MTTTPPLSVAPAAKPKLTVLGVLSDAREAAHSLLAIVGVAAGSAGAIASGLDAFGLHVGSPDVAHVAFIAGLAVTAASKGIDSLNNALTSLGVK